MTVWWFYNYITFWGPTCCSPPRHTS